MRTLIIITILLIIKLNVYAQDSVYTNPIGMKFVLIRPGFIRIGKFDPPYPKPGMAANPYQQTYSDTDYKQAEALAKKDSDTGFVVEIEKAFYMGVYEVTQGQWNSVMDHNPSTFKDGENRKNHPVESISWEDIQVFLARLNAMDKRKQYRLPTEFEWEYAAAASEGEDIAWEEIRKRAQLGTRTTNPVGLKKPNAWGLYDMLGNVWEWTADYYNGKLFADPVPAKTGSLHVLKGASFTGDVKNATFKTHAAGPANGWDVGFRLVAEEK